ncbi:hypothetical protein [Streptomyces sp. NBC_01236]|uniref:hypothetical protein n=1 Tax=Streptomyces sp. NBC_01236 TaxID=2903789 RepID=UPI002E0F3799|nr:hypothetical protein OG324_29590 [Streptomyces sp. NBC_01236]
MTDPVSRTILLLDIEKYSDRDDVEQAYLRRMLYDITDRTLESAGIDERLRLRADRGDSVMELIDANASVTALLRALLTEVPVQLRAVNRMASSSAQIRLRGVVATGYVAIDDHDGWVGSDLNHACRLLDAQLLRAALRERANDFALCVSEGVHTGIVRHGHPGIPAEDFHPVTVDSKNGALRAWLHGPVPHGTDDHSETRGTDDHSEKGGAPAPGDSGESPAPGAEPPASPGPASPASPAAPPGGVVFQFNGGSATFGGSLVGGDQHGVSGGQVTGDVHLGGSGGESA